MFMFGRTSLAKSSANPDRTKTTSPCRSDLIARKGMETKFDIKFDSNSLTFEDFLKNYLFDLLFQCVS